LPDAAVLPSKFSFVVAVEMIVLALKLTTPIVPVIVGLAI
jgi:hypothetical protein